MKKNTTKNIAAGIQIGEKTHHQFQSRFSVIFSTIKIICRIETTPSPLLLVFPLSDISFIVGGYQNVLI
jgi:hypothetical protein